MANFIPIFNKKASILSKTIVLMKNLILDYFMLFCAISKKNFYSAKMIIQIKKQFSTKGSKNQ